MYLASHPSVLLALLSTCATVSAYTGCYYGEMWIPRIPGPPSVADCLTLFAHIPSQPNPIINEAPTSIHHPIQHHSPNSPFFPQVSLHRGDCVAQISYYAGPQPPHDWQAAGFILDRQHFTPLVPLSESSIFKIWGEARASVQSILAQCVPTHRNGVSWVPVSVPEIASAWVTVHVRSFGGMGRHGWRQPARVEGRHALKGYSRGVRGKGGAVRNKFEITFLDVLG